MCLGGALTSGHYHSFLLEREQKLLDKDLTFGGNSDWLGNDVNINLKWAFVFSLKHIPGLTVSAS